MNWLSRKLQQLRRSADLGHGLVEKLRLVLYQINGALGDQPARGSGYLMFRLKHQADGTPAICYLRRHKSDWIIFREIFYFDDYADVSRFSFVPEVIYDIGANAGLAAVYLHLVFPKAKIFGFEPGIPEYECARENYGHNKLGEVFPIAVGDKNGEMTFLVNESASGGQGFAPVDGMNGVPEPRPVRRLEDFVGEFQLPAADLIKMDIEGFEVKALQGMGPLLKKAKGIVMETHGPELHSAVLALLAEAGFHVIADEHRFDVYRILLAERMDLPKPTL